MNATKIETRFITLACFAMASVPVYLVLDRLEVLPCKLTLADVPPDFEIVHDNGVYRARFKETKLLLTPYNDSDHSLCQAIERAMRQYEFRQKDRREQAREWEVVK